MMQWVISSPPEARYRVLYVGADLGLMEFVREALGRVGGFVVRCPGGSMARLLLSSGIYYDLLMFDEELMGESGREMVRFARSLEHRRRTPVILLSQQECAGKGWQAGGRALLQKPEPFEAVVQVIRRLLKLEKGK
jgi:DNA-binding response OmpR family regulator